MFDLELYEAIVDNLYDGITVTDSQGEILLVNQALEKLSGITRTSYMGRNIRDIIQSGIFQKPSVTLRALTEKKTITDFQQYQNGITVLVTAVPLFDSQQNLVRIMANIHDITELMITKSKLDETEKLSAKYFSELVGLRKQYQKRGIITASDQMHDILELIARVAPTDSTILLLGESGVGKEVLAREVHENSKRSETGAFIKVNCGAIPADLLESEFFGYAPGAFTGARKEGKPGLFELADEGTLFLDEVGELPLPLQVKLLRVLQEQQFTRVGGTDLIEVNTRIVAATNRNLEAMVAKGEFREDLYYRLHVIPIHIPPLRERREDIPLLIGHFLRVFSEKYNIRKSISPEALEHAERYHWPGNIRELSNVVERLVLTTKEDCMEKADLPFIKASPSSGVPPFLDLDGGNLFEAMEKKLILSILESEGSIRRAAKKLGVSHTTLIRKMTKHELRN